MAVGDAYVFPGFVTPVQTLLFFTKPPTTFLICFCRGEREKCAGKKSCLNRGSNSQPPGHEWDTLTTDPPGRGLWQRDNEPKGESVATECSQLKCQFQTLQRPFLKQVHVFTMFQRRNYLYGNFSFSYKLFHSFKETSVISI